MTRRNRTAGPKDLIWSGSVQWESGPNSPVYAYVFGLDENVVDRVLQHIQQAVIDKEFSENYPFWVEWLGQSRITSPEEVRQGIEESIRIRNPSRHRLDELWIEGAHMPEVESAIENDPLVIDFPTVSFEELAPYCRKADALRDFVIGVEAPTMTPEMIGASARPHRRRTAAQDPMRKIRSKASQALTKLHDLQIRLGMDLAQELELGNIKALLAEIHQIARKQY